MATLKEIRARIGSVKNTRKITSAMSRIASARLARAQRAMLDQRPYGERMETVVGQLVGELKADDAHPLLERRDVHKVAVIAVTADRGLCGPFNANVNKAAYSLIQEREAAGQEVVVVGVGRKVRQFLEARGIRLYENHPAPDYKTATEVAHRVAIQAVSMFKEHDEAATGLAQVDEVILVYNHFKNVLSQDVRATQLLPVAAKEPSPDEPETMALEREHEPDLGALLDHLLPVAVETTVQTAMLNSSAAELAAKRVAMDAATDNASELIRDLTLEYNRGRQAAITSELIEIISGAEAL